MNTRNGICVKVDQEKKVGVADVIAMLKGLRTEVAVKVIQTAEKKNSSGTAIFTTKKESGLSLDDVTGNKSFFPSTPTADQSDYPQIEELNDIAHLLKGVDTSNNEVYSMFRD